MKIAISNFSPPIQSELDFSSFWTNFTRPDRGQRLSLFEMRVDWGFHIYSVAVYLMDKGVADEIEFWDYARERSVAYHSSGILRIMFHNERDVAAYLKEFGYPDLCINYGRFGLPMFQLLKGKCFRVHVPASRFGLDRQHNYGADCYLVDAEQYLDECSILYVPVVNVKKIFPNNCQKERDFIYLASAYPSKRHDILLNAVRGTELTGHFHPVDGSTQDLSNTSITTTKFDEVTIVDLLRTSRMAVYPADRTSNPAAMWECVAAGLPIIMNETIDGGKHLVIPGITGEFASEENLYDVMKHVLENLDSYHPREYFMQHWDTVPTIETYLSFFRRMGWEH